MAGAASTRWTCSRSDGGGAAMLVRAAAAVDRDDAVDAAAEAAAAALAASKQLEHLRPTCLWLGTRSAVQWPVHFFIPPLLQSTQPAHRVQARQPTHEQKVGAIMRNE